MACVTGPVGFFPQSKLIFKAVLKQCLVDSES